MSPTPQQALRLLGGGTTDLTAVTDVAELGRHTVVLLSGAVSAETVARIAAAGTDNVVIAIDLLDPPASGALGALSGRFHDRFTRWGDLPVAVVETTGSRPVDPGLLVNLASLIGTAPTRSGDDEAMLTMALQFADEEQERLRERIRRLRGRLDDSRARTQHVARERDDAQRRLQATERRAVIRATGLLGRVARRLPGGGRTGLLLAGVVGLVAVAAIATAATLAGRAGLATLLTLALLGLGLNLLLTLRAGAPRPQEGLAAIRETRRQQRVLHDEVAALTAQLAEHRAEVEPLAGASAERLDDVTRSLAKIPAQRAGANARLLAQVQETTRLFATYPTTARVPAMGGWAASADLISALLDEFVERRPALVVECGSGVSTLWLALAARQHGIATRIVSLDHDASYAAATRATLVRHGVDHLAEVRHAPLLLTDVDGDDRPWYATTAIDDLEGIEMLVVDGPPAATGPLARYPAVALLRDRMAERCTIVADDTRRADDQEVVRRWLDLVPGFDHTELPLEKGASILRRG